MYSDTTLQHSYRRMFNLISADMDNWKKKIVICIDSDEMHGATDEIRIRRAVVRMFRIKRAIEFMVGGPSRVTLHENADGSGKTVILRNAGYYVNIGA